MPFNPNIDYSKKEQFAPRHMVIPENVDKGVPEIEKQVTTYKKHCIVVDSRDRNRNQYASPNYFRIKVSGGDTITPDDQLTQTKDVGGLYHKFSNIVSVKLVQCVLPNTIADLAYLILVIPELQDTMIGTNDKLRKAFAILTPDNSLGNNFFSCRMTETCDCIKIFSPPLSGIESLTFEFYDPTGELVDFGNDTTEPTAPNPLMQSLCIIELKTEVISRSKLKHNIV